MTRRNIAQLAAAVLALGLATALAEWSWAHREGTWLQEFGDGPRFYVVLGKDWPLDRALVPLIRSQLEATAAEYAPSLPSAAASAPMRRPPMLEIVQLHARNHGGRFVVWILGTCEALAKGHGDREARFLDVPGGGPCSFEAEFEVPTRRLNWLRLNDRDTHASVADERWRQVRGGDWWIDLQTMGQMRAQLPAATDDTLSGRFGMAPDRRQIVVPIAQYFVQAKGHLEGGKHFVDLIGTCVNNPGTEHLRNWQLLLVLDGGPCFFNAEFDADNQRFISFMFNGPYLPRPSSS